MCKRRSRDDTDHPCWKCGNSNVIRKAATNYDAVAGMRGREVLDIAIAGEDSSAEEDDMDGWL